MADDKSLSQQYYEAVEAKKADGISNADAIRQVAEQFGKKEGAVRGGIHQYKNRDADSNGASPRRGRRRTASSVEDHLASAKRSLEEALELIDGEVDAAKAALDTAQKRYDTAVSSVKERKADIEKKLKALA